MAARAGDLQKGKRLNRPGDNTNSLNFSAARQNPPRNRRHDLDSERHRWIARLLPDVVLFDAARWESVAFVKTLVASAPHSKIVAFGVKETAEEFLALAAAGTAGYVRDSAESNDAVNTLEQVMCDELPCSPRAAASLYRRVATLSQGSDAPIGVANGNHN
jgi:DNA-binding NarL/FixJ family response regulator